jgi:hypothetical protein
MSRGAERVFRARTKGRCRSLLPRDTDLQRVLLAIEHVVATGNEVVIRHLVRVRRGPPAPGEFHLKLAFPNALLVKIIVELPPFRYLPAWTHDAVRAVLVEVIVRILPMFMGIKL